MHTGRSQSKNSDSRFGLPRFVQCKRADIESSAKRQVRKTYSRADLHYAPGSSSTIKLAITAPSVSGVAQPCTPFLEHAGRVSGLYTVLLTLDARRQRWYCEHGMPIWSRVAWRCAGAGFALSVWD